jgi:hypothetical protein
MENVRNMAMHQHKTDPETGCEDTATAEIIGYFRRLGDLQ